MCTIDGVSDLFQKRTFLLPEVSGLFHNNFVILPIILSVLLIVAGRSDKEEWRLLYFKHILVIYFNFSTFCFVCNLLLLQNGLLHLPL